MLARRGWWISPEGKIYLFDVGGRHIYFMRDNPHLFGLTSKEVKELKLVYDGGPIREKFIKKALKQNWIRVRERNNSTVFNFRVFNIDVLERIRKLLSQYKFWDNDWIELIPIEGKGRLTTVSWLKSNKAKKEVSKNDVIPDKYNKK